VCVRYHTRVWPVITAAVIVIAMIVTTSGVIKGDVEKEKMFGDVLS